MPARTAVIAGVLGLLVILNLVVWHNNMEGRPSPAPSKRVSAIQLPPAAQRFEDNETAIHNDVVARVAQTAEECDRLHLPNAVRVKRINAVFEAGMAEIRRVRASHYRVAFDRNYLVPNVN